MRWFHDLSTLVKLLGTFAVVLVFTAVVGFVGITRLAAQNDVMDTLYREHMLGLSYIMQANIDTVASGRAEKNAILANDPAERQKQATAARTFLTAAADDMAKFKPLITLDRTRTVFAAAEL